MTDVDEEIYSQLLELFDDRTLDRAEGLLDRKAVLSYRYDRHDEVWHARVQGRQPRPYSVEVRIEHDHGELDVSGSCSCPMGSMCKHVAATTLRLIERELGPTWAEPDLDSDPPRPDLDPVARWLNQAEPQRDGSPQEDGVELRYVIEVHEAEAGYGLAIDVDVYAVGLGQQSCAELEPYDLTAVLRGPPRRWPAFLSKEDRRIWAELLGFQVSTWGDTTIPPGPDGAELVRRFIETGRCHLVDLEDPPLQWAAARPGRIRWRELADGEQFLAIDVDSDSEAGSIEILPLESPHYIDTHTAECGPVTLAPGSAEIPLAGAPRLEPGHALAKATLTRLRAAGLPLPRQRKIRRLGDLEPICVLDVRSDPASFGPPRWKGELSFDYGGHMVRGIGVRGLQRVLVGKDELVELERRPQLELSRVRRLEQNIGLEVWDNTVRGDNEAWRTLLWQHGHLEQKGFRVEFDPACEIDFLDPDRWEVEVNDQNNGWFSVGVGVEIEGERVELLPHIVAALCEGRIRADRVLPGARPTMIALADGRIVKLAPDRLATVLDTLVELHGRPRLLMGRLHLPGEMLVRLSAFIAPGFDWTGSDRHREFAAKVANYRAPPSVEPPSSLSATLRAYQRDGLSWLQALRDLGLGGILADDMGLGKTIQAIAHILCEKEAGRLDRPCLVVAPTSVLPNWILELQRFAPGLTAVLVHGTDRAPALGRLQEADVVVTSYALLRRESALRDDPYHLVILDEAQAIKNPKSKSAVLARGLQARQKIALTGTPMENNLMELWSIVEFTNPGVLGSASDFQSWYRTPIERRGDPLRLAELTRRVAPLFLRRRKAEVLSELPPKTEVVLHAELRGSQRDLYESIRVSVSKAVRQALKARGLARSRIVVLDALLKLRQVCCDPRLVKAERAQRVKRSAKLEVLFDLLEQLVAEGRRALVFSQFTELLAIIRAELEARQIEHVVLTGRTRARQPIIDRFQNGDVPLFLVSLKAGGTGLNLTAADTVVHVDPWWNPAVERQATDRTHRIGQTQPVTIYKLVCRDTVEERVLDLQERKQALIDLIEHGVDERRSGGLGLDTESLEALLAPL